MKGSREGTYKKGEKILNQGRISSTLLFFHSRLHVTYIFLGLMGGHHIIQIQSGKVDIIKVVDENLTIKVERVHPGDIIGEVVCNKKKIELLFRLF